MYSCLFLSACEEKIVYLFVGERLISSGYFSRFFLFDFVYSSVAALFFCIPQKDLEDILSSSAKHAWQQAASFCLKMKRVTHLF